MESSSSLSSQASSLPPIICENPEYIPLTTATTTAMTMCENPEYLPLIPISENRENLPPALPPKRHRTNTKLNNLNATPPSSPKLILSESVENNPTTNNLSSQNNNTLNNGCNKCDNIGPKPINIQATSPSSNYVQITTSTINAAAAAEAAKQTNGIVAKTEPIVKSNNDSVPNISVSDTKAVNNDVRVIYTNVNILKSTNNRSSDDNHYTQLCDASGDDRKPNAIAKIDSEPNTTQVTAATTTTTTKTKTTTTSTDIDRCSTQQNSSQTNNNNNNNSINDKNADDEEDVVLRRPPASSSSSLKVLTHFNT